MDIWFLVTMVGVTWLIVIVVGGYLVNSQYGWRNGGYLFFVIIVG